MSLTDGRGVDLVLNSLAGEFIPGSLKVTKENGRFVEIGRTDIWSAQQVQEFRPDIEYHTVLLGDVSESNPELIQRLGEEIVDKVDAGTLSALPLQCWPMGKAADAFRLMARAGHTGKIVLTVSDFGRAERAEEPIVRTDGAYLISGGFGGLGLKLAGWLAAQGAGLIALLGHHDPDEQAIAAIAALRGFDVTVLPIVCDVTKSAEVQQAVEQVEQHAMTLRGVIHAAGTLDDGVLSEQNWMRFQAVIAAKITGAWTLHESTENQPLDFFVLFSSASALFGAAGQAGYAAGNAFLDALARWRRGRGQPALSVNWGPWADVGMFARSGVAGQRSVSGRGFEFLDAERNLAALAILLKTRIAGAGVFTADWAAFDATRQSSGSSPLVVELVGQSAAASITATDDSAFADELRAAPSARRIRLMRNRLRKEVAAVLNSTADSILTNQGFRELGMDSLMSVELRNRLQRLLDCSLVSTVAFDYPNVQQLGEYLLREIVDASAVSNHGQSPLPTSSPMSFVEPDKNVSDLSDEEAEQLLLKELARLREADRYG
jgi:NAD(P)-dependent dehydrogenase (short-subunit alcohol dehydrogenase family)/acyl carrier protein